jgi:thioredoxin reductase (NADPH)
MELVNSLDRREDGFTVRTSKNEYSAPAVILATGAKHRHLNIPGEEEFSGKGVSYCATCDGPFFKGRKILVVGGGDAACDETQYLSKLSDRIIQIHRRDRFRAQPSLAERVLNNPNVEVRFNSVLEEIKGDQKVTSVIIKKTDTGETSEEEMDAVFIFIGSDPQTQLVPDGEKDESGYLITDQGMATSIPGLFAVGDARATPFRQIVTSCSDGAIAAHKAAMYIDELNGRAYV